MRDRISLLLLPGLDGTGELFAPLLSELPESIQARIIRYPKDPHLELNDYIEVARSQLNGFEPDIILGESFSGRIAFELAAVLQDSTPLLILAASFLCGPRPWLLSRYSCIWPLIRAAHPPRRFMLRQFCLGAAAFDDVVALARDTIAQISPELVISRLRLIAELEQPQTSVDIPAVYLQASNDRLVSRRSAIEAKRSLPRLQVIEIPGAHFVLQSNPKEAAKVICTFAETYRRRSVT